MSVSPAVYKFIVANYSTYLIKFGRCVLYKQLYTKFCFSPFPSSLILKKTQIEFLDIIKLRLTHGQDTCMAYSLVGEQNYKDTGSLYRSDYSSSNDCSLKSVK